MLTYCLLFLFSTYVFQRIIYIFLENTEFSLLSITSEVSWIYDCEWFKPSWQRTWPYTLSWVLSRVVALTKSIRRIISYFIAHLHPTFLSLGPPLLRCRKKRDFKQSKLAMNFTQNECITLTVWKQSYSEA